MFGHAAAIVGLINTLVYTHETLVARELEFEHVVAMVNLAYLLHDLVEVADFLFDLLRRLWFEALLQIVLAEGGNQSTEGLLLVVEIALKLGNHLL